MDIVNTDTIWQAVLGYWFILGALAYLVVFTKEFRRRQFWLAAFLGGPMCWIAVPFVFIFHKLGIRWR